MFELHFIVPRRANVSGSAPCKDGRIRAITLISSSISLIDQKKSNVQLSGFGYLSNATVYLSPCLSYFEIRRIFEIHCSESDSTGRWSSAPNFFLLGILDGRT